MTTHTELAAQARERQILFQGAMVRAIIDGSKTQTRRPLYVLTNSADKARFDSRHPEFPTMPPVGKMWTLSQWCKAAAGDRLWVREAFSGHYLMDADDELPAMPPRDWPVDSPIWYWADGEPTHGDWTRPRPSIHMPRWASRITLEITGVRVERLQDISEADALAEGIQRWPLGFRVELSGAPKHESMTFDTAVGAFRFLWESINGPGSWDANPWVWVVEFRRIQ